MTRAHAQVSAAPVARDLHLVVPTIGRPTLPRVVEEALEREQALARVTVVAQVPLELPMRLSAQAEDAGVVLRVLSLPSPVGAARARDAGVDEGTEPWIAFLDDDISVLCGSLTELQRGCKQQGLAGACGVVSNAVENTAAYRLLKTALFRGIFHDSRATSAADGVARPSRVLSGGMTVYRADAYERCRHTQLDYEGYTWGEDFELSFCISRHDRLLIDTRLRVRNEAAGVATGRRHVDVALARLARYQRFALRYARSRRDWWHFQLVLAGVLVVGLRGGGGWPLLAAVTAESWGNLGRLVRGQHPP